MKVLIAPDSFKESLPAKEVAEIIVEGLRQSLLDVEPLICPVGDGGEGTVDAISYSLIEGNLYPCHRSIWGAGRNAVYGEGFSGSL